MSILKGRNQELLDALGRNASQASINAYCRSRGWTVSRKMINRARRECNLARLQRLYENH